MVDSLYTNAWNTLVVDQLVEEKNGTVNQFIYIMRGRLLGYLSELGADIDGDPRCFSPGHRIIKDVNDLYHKTLNYAFKKSRDPIPEDLAPVITGVNPPQLDKKTERSSLVVLKAIHDFGSMKHGEVSYTDDISAFINAQCVIVFYGIAGLTSEGVDYINKLADIWTNTLTGEQIMPSKEDIQELNALFQRFQQSIS